MTADDEFMEGRMTTYVCGHVALGEREPNGACAECFENAVDRALKAEARLAKMTRERDEARENAAAILRDAEDRAEATWKERLADAQRERDHMIVTAADLQVALGKERDRAAAAESRAAEVEAALRGLVAAIDMIRRDTGLESFGDGPALAAARAALASPAAMGPSPIVSLDEEQKKK